MDLVLNFGPEGSWVAFREARDRWLSAHGVDPGDRAAVSAVERASRVAHGVDGALARAGALAKGRAARKAQS